MKIKNKEAEVNELDYFIEGSLSDIGENRQLNIGLVSARTGNNIWTDQYEFKIENNILKINNQTTMESLILAQDKRWRRA